MMLELAATGCHNINIVTPDALTRRPCSRRSAGGRGGPERTARLEHVMLRDARTTLELLDGVVDVYLADIRYAADAEPAGAYSDAPDYPTGQREALREMQAQVGTLRTGRGGHRDCAGSSCGTSCCRRGPREPADCLAIRGDGTRAGTPSSVSCRSTTPRTGRDEHPDRSGLHGIGVGVRRSASPR